MEENVSECVHFKLFPFYQFFVKKNNEKKIELPETLLDFVTIFLGGGWAIFFIKIPCHMLW